MSGRSRSLAMTVFFEAELLGVNEVPHRSIIDLKTALGKFGHQPAPSKFSFSDPLHQKGLVLAGNCLWLFPAHLAPRPPACFLKPPNPIDHRAGCHAELSGSPMPRQPAFQNRRDSTLTKVNR